MQSTVSLVLRKGQFIRYLDGQNTVSKEHYEPPPPDCLPSYMWRAVKEQSTHWRGIFIWPRQ